MAFLGEHIPELAEKLGIDSSQLSQQGEYLGKLAVVTFRNPHYDTGGRLDPVADLPPNYSRYGILDRDHRDRVEAGQTWIVQPYTPTGSQAVFMIPICEVDLASLLALDESKVKELARELVENRPDLTKALADLLPTQAEPASDPEEVRQLRKALARADKALASASKALGESREVTLNALEDAADKIAQAHATVADVPPAAEPQPTVKLVPKKKPAAPLPIFLADANLFINAERWKSDDANLILDHADMRFQLATTRRVYDELKHSYRLPQSLKVIDVGDIDARLHELADANASAIGKKAGENDLSLIQAMLDNDEIRGIITEDPDIVNIHPPSLVKQMTGREVECLQSRQFCERHKKLVR